MILTQIHEIVKIFLNSAYSLHILCYFERGLTSTRAHKILSVLFVFLAYKYIIGICGTKNFIAA